MKIGKILEFGQAAGSARITKTVWKSCQAWLVHFDRYCGIEANIYKVDRYAFWWLAHDSLAIMSIQSSDVQ